MDSLLSLAMIVRVLPRVILATVVIGLMLAAITSPPNAQQTAPSCIAFHAARPDSPHAFTQATLIALSFLQEAVRENEEFQNERKAGLDAQGLLIAMMRHTKTTSDSYSCAERVLEPYKKSHDQKIIGRTAEFLAAIYGRHRELNDQFLGLLRNIPDHSNSPAKRADVISTIEVERSKLWKDLINGTTVALIGLFDQNKPDKDGTLHTLLITRSERKELLDRVQRYFPGVKDQVGKPNTSDLIFVASLYYEFLTKPNKSADE